MELTAIDLKHVASQWDDEVADGLDPVERLVYRSNLLGRDWRITNTGGGNTSSKLLERDPLTGEPVEVLWVKGSGGDLRTAKRAHFASLYQSRLLALQHIYARMSGRGPKTPAEDAMVAMYEHCTFNLNPRACSIDTPLHSFVPYKHVDHTHPVAVIALATAANGPELTREVYGDDVIWTDWQRPGFELGLKLQEICRAHPLAKGVILGGHGLINWADDDKACYQLTLTLIDQAERFLALHDPGTRAFGGQKYAVMPEERRVQVLVEVLPWLRGQVSQERRFIGTVQTDEAILEFVNSTDAPRLAELGTSCPDHFLRTKIKPLYVDWNPERDDVQSLKEQLAKGLEQYRKDYASYYDQHKHPNSPAMRDPNPTVVLIPGVGMVAWGKTKSESRVTAEFYNAAVGVMRGAESVSTYTALPKQEAFDIEYWLLEEAKLQRMPKEKPLSRKIAFVTGGAGGIGKAIATKLASEGACVFVADLHEDRLKETVSGFSRDVGAGSVVDVTSEGSVREAIARACLAFGGVDIIVNCAGLAISKPLEETTTADWDLLNDVIVKGQFEVSKAAVEVLRAQALGGDIVNIVSKNALVSGPNNVAYGTAKAAQIHMSRLLAAELGKDKIRVNVVNPDAVIEGSKIWEGAWAEGRAKAYGVKVEELPAFYAKRTILNEIISVDDIANGVFVLVGGHLNKSTGNVINVDGGVAAAFVR